MEYEGKVPAARIKIKNLKEFEDILLRDCKFTMPNHFREISIKFRNFSEKSSTVKRFLDDPTLPKEIRDFSWRINCKEGNIRLRTNSLSAEVTISGSRGWVIKKKEDIYTFLKKHKKLSRAIFNSSLFLLGGLIFGFIVLDYSNEIFKSVGFSVYGASLFLSGLFLMIFNIIQFSGYERKFIPHLTIELEEIEKYRWKENFLVTFVTSIISAWVIILIMSLLEG